MPNSRLIREGDPLGYAEIHEIAHRLGESVQQHPGQPLAAHLQRVMATLLNADSKIMLGWVKKPTFRPDDGLMQHTAVDKEQFPTPPPEFFAAAREYYQNEKNEDEGTSDDSSESELQSPEQ